MSTSPTPGSSAVRDTGATRARPRRRGAEGTGHRSGWKVWVAILVGAVLSVVLAAVNGLQLASIERALGGVGTPETQVGGYDVGYVELVQSRMTDELLERYGAYHYLWDILFPLVFAGTLILLIFRLCAGRKRRYLLVFAPALFAGVDIAENITLESLITSLDVAAGVVTLASALTIAKTVLLGLSLASALLALLTRPRESRALGDVKPGAAPTAGS